VKTLPDDLPVVFVVGAMAHGSVRALPFLSSSLSPSHHSLTQRSLTQSTQRSITHSIQQVEVDYVERHVSFSEYPLSASVACGKICDAFEMKYGIL
jgi:rRNA pseudouridine-1189 N-methylase Emg1 (Nep1/Mra1 family)